MISTDAEASGLQFCLNFSLIEVKNDIVALAGISSKGDWMTILSGDNRIFRILFERCELLRSLMCSSWVDVLHR